MEHYIALINVRMSDVVKEIVSYYHVIIISDY